MAEIIRMPKMSDTMTEGVIVAWNKKVGDTVAPGDILAEVETDKATMELENYVKGTLLHIGVDKGDAVPVDAIIAVVGEKGEDIKAILKEEQKAATPEADKKEETPQAEKKEEAREPVAEDSTPQVSKSEIPAPAPAKESNVGRVKASPLAKKLAEDKGIDISLVQGSGDFGRIVKRDIENYAPAAGMSGSPASFGQEAYTEQPVSQMRKTIARRLAESKFTSPHFYLTMEIEMDRAVAARESINEYADVKVSINDIIVKAAAIALRKHPGVNSSWLGDKIRLNQHIHVGVAMAVEDGLLVPVVRFADQKSLSDISRDVKAYSEKAKNKKLQPADWEGNTFTISNLGMFGIEEFTAIINPPDACILAVGAVKETVIVKNGEMRAGQVMKVTLSCDHRVVDGVVGSKFLLTLRELLEEPVKILV